MIVNNVTLDKVTVSPSNYPSTGYPEIAFAGKSNVGKSSLINSMIYRKALARTSQTPGKTRTINFYNIEDCMYFVDLPGYGFARAPKHETDKWAKMIEEYLLNRKELKGIVMLTDIRHAPGENDLMMYSWLKHYNYKIIIAATKHDKLKKSQYKKHKEMLKSAFNLQKDDILIPFSSETKEGRDELWKVLEELTGIVPV